MVEVEEVEVDLGASDRQIRDYAKLKEEM